MKRVLHTVSEDGCEKQARMTCDGNEEQQNEPSTSKTLTNAEKRARNAEKQRRYRARLKQQNNALSTTSTSIPNIDREKEKRTKHAEKRARNAERQRQYRARLKQQNNALSTTSTSIPNIDREKEKRTKHAEAAKRYRSRQKEMQQQQQHTSAPLGAMARVTVPIETKELPRNVETTSNIGKTLSPQYYITFIDRTCLFFKTTRTATYCRPFRSIIRQYCEPDSGSETCVTTLDDGTEEGNIKVEEVGIKDEETLDMKEENSEGTAFPSIKAEPEVSVWACV